MRDHPAEGDTGGSADNVTVPAAGPLVSSTLRSHKFLLVPLGLAAALSFYSLGAKSMWYDEAFSVAVARLDWPAMWRVMRTNEPNMALYYGLLHYWLSLGSDEFTVRALSALLAVASVLALYALGKRLSGEITALAASTLLAVNAFFIQYAQEARSYSLLLLLTTASSLLFISALEEPCPKKWASYVAVTALATYAQFFAFWVVAAQFVAAMVIRGRPVPKRAVLVSQMAVALLAIPLIAWTLTAGHRLSWLKRPTGRTVLDFLQTITGYGGPVHVVLYLGLCCLSLLAAWASRRQRDDGERTWNRAFLLTWLLLPVLGTLTFSLLVTPMFHPRFLILCLPPLVLLVADGALSLRPGFLRAGALLLVFALSVRGLSKWYTGFPKHDWRAATEYVLMEAEPADGIVFRPPWLRVPFEYYLREHTNGATRLQPVFPSASWGAYDFLSPEIHQTFSGWLARHPEHHKRVWFVDHPSSERLNAGPPDWVPHSFPTRYCRLQDGLFVRRIRVMLYRVCGGEPGKVSPGEGG